MENEIYKNERDPGTDSTTGEDANVRFDKLAEKFGYETRRANERENRIGHWDTAIIKDGKERKVDVKAMRKIFGEVQDKVMVLEFKGITGQMGWMYGAADIIAFETVDGFILVHRNSLLIMVTKDERLPMFHHHNKPDRKDDFIYVPVEYLLKAKNIVWNE